ncbi:MAG TPA: glycosyltransferase [Planctomycetota bacterium]|nr:glycosyltransferase [Planctomycetota bacterium]
MSTTLLVASAGGHLAELHRLRQRLPGAAEIAWITTEHSHSRSLLAHENALFLPHSPSRSVRAALRNLRLTRATLKSLRPTRVVSNGASIAVPILAQAAWRGIPAHYIESAARVVGPSMTGKLLQHVPGVRTYTQWPGWASRRWRFAGSVMDGWEACTEARSAPIRRVVVTVGTESWPFRALFEHVRRCLPAGVDVLWQCGCTPVQDLGLTGVASLPAHELERAIGEADLVIAHSGVGSALAAIDKGKAPVLLPRRTARGEAVDDHQAQIGRELALRNLAVFCEVEELTPNHLERAAATAVRRRAQVPPLDLA